MHIFLLPSELHYQSKNKKKIDDAVEFFKYTNACCCVLGGVQRTASLFSV